MISLAYSALKAVHRASHSVNVNDGDAGWTPGWTRSKSTEGTPLSLARRSSFITNFEEGDGERWERVLHKLGQIFSQHMYNLYCNSN